VRLLQRDRTEGVQQLVKGEVDVAGSEVIFPDNVPEGNDLSGLGVVLGAGTSMNNQRKLSVGRTT